MTRTLFITIGIALLLQTGAVRLSAQGGSDIVGTWDMTTVSPEGDRPNTMVVTKEGDKLKAVAKSERGERPYDSIEVKGSDVTIVLTIDYNGTPMIITYSGKVDKTSMKGDADFGGLATGTWSAVKK
jgi:hypothetical protein